MALHSQRDASIQAGPDAILKGDLMIPDGANLTGAVVIAYASPRPRRNAFNLSAAASLRDIGLATLLIDLLTIEEKTSASAPTSAELLAPRLGAVTQFLRCQSGAGRLAIGYVATGEASPAALLAAASLGDAIGAVVLAGARSLRLPLRPEEVTAPVLLIVGGTASELELGCATRDRLTCRSDVVMVPGATLTCKGDPRPRRLAIQLAVDWFADQLGTAGDRAHTATRGSATAMR
jgi:putative phosphoribosyl transferase